MKIGKYKKLIRRLIYLVIVVVIITIIYIVDFTKDEIKYGVTFSSHYAQDELGLEWRETYIAILDDLEVDNIRLSAYWNYIESDIGNYWFEDLDWQINEAVKRDADIVLAIGRRLPRWPECHDPKWLKDLEAKSADESTSQQAVRDKQLEFVKTIVARYNDNENIVMWQIENEPFLSGFGECPPLDRELFEQEIAMVKEISDKPILITDSGELSMWTEAGSSGGDYLGSTLYRVVYNSKIGYIKYPIPASWYTFKSWLVKKFTDTDKVIVAELQAEAWHPEDKTLPNMSLPEQFKSLSPKQFQNNIQYAEKAGFDEIYLWGVEWWYYLKTERDYDTYWEEASKLWK